MNKTASPSKPLLGSITLHLLILGLLLWGGWQSTIKPAPPPLALELWSSPPASKPSQPAPSAKVQQTISAPPAPAADIQLGPKTPPKPKPPPTQATTPTHPQAAPHAVIKPKPLEKADKQAREVAPKKIATQAPKTAKTYQPNTDDLLAGLDSTSSKQESNARHHQAGSKQGIAGGAIDGSSVSSSWINQVKAKVTPLVDIPPSVKGNPSVLVRVTLLPTLEVKAVELLQSSGNTAYDDAVQRAIWETKRMPSLPNGVSFNNQYRVFNLAFRPR
ncbi:TonB C-terminal domain-containing protein [Neisseriaceae bacterium TC5R-5]|nr:TonB C-terminal domain-containing protein [Neisseriaceae bacterium TC5R-5]